MVHGALWVQLWEQRQNMSERPLIDEDGREEGNCLNTHCNEWAEPWNYRWNLTRLVNLSCGNRSLSSMAQSKLSNATCVGLVFHRNVQLANHTLLNYTAEMINTIVATLAREMALEETKPQACLWRLLSLKATVFDNHLFLGEYLLFMRHSWMD